MSTTNNFFSISIFWIISVVLPLIRWSMMLFWSYLWLIITWLYFPTFLILSSTTNKSFLISISFNWTSLSCTTRCSTMTMTIFYIFMFFTISITFSVLSFPGMFFIFWWFFFFVAIFCSGLWWFYFKWICVTFFMTEIIKKRTCCWLNILVGLV